MTFEERGASACSLSLGFLLDNPISREAHVRVRVRVRVVVVYDVVVRLHMHVYDVVVRVHVHVHDMVVGRGRGRG